MALFSSSVQDALRKLERGQMASSAERDELLQAVVDNASSLKAKDVIWMLFRPDKAVRGACIKVLQTTPTLDTVDIFLNECRGKPEAALRAASAVLFELNIRGVENHLAERLKDKEEHIQDAVRNVVLGAPVTSRALVPLLWRLVATATGPDRFAFLDRLAAFDLEAGSLKAWQKLATDDDRTVREKALTVLAERSPETSVDLMVAELPRVSNATQERLITALTTMAGSRGVNFADQILPLMASGDSGTRSAVLKILIGMPQQAELIKRYISFSKTLAGWARDRALDSMKEFGPELIEHIIELLHDANEEVRAAALVVAGSFDDRRIVPATIALLKDPDWWVRITAADTLGHLGDALAVDALIEVLGDPDTRWAAVEALGRIGDTRSLQALGNLLRDPAAEVRIEVLLALRNFQHPKILGVLRQVAANDPDRGVRARALEIAQQVAERDQVGMADSEQLRNAAYRVEAKEAGEPRLHAMLVGTRGQAASDLHLAVSVPPMIRLGADLVPIKGDALTAQETEAMILEILTKAQRERLERDKQVDFCYWVPRAGRYRGNVFYDHRGLNGAFRVIPEQTPTLADIGLPGHLAEIADYHQGLVVICGPAGSGKSTTLAALVNLFNETRYDHILTMEDPVEFVHPFKNCLVNQREVGTHTGSFARALRAALREDPDVIVIGDLRDNETVSLALTAAETGHIVLGTLNSTTAHKAIDRLISSFSAQEQPQVRASLSESLKFVIAQKLIPGKGDRRRVAVFEVLRGTMSVGNMIRDEKTFQIPSAMQMGRSLGMQTFDGALRELVRSDLIDAETAYMAAESKQDFETMVSPEFLESQTFV